MFTKKLTPFVLVLALALVLTACGPAATSGSETTPANIYVNGVGTVYIVPNIAYIYIGVHTENPAISQAVTSNNTLAQTVIDALKGLGIEAKDLQTSNFSVYTSQQYDPATGLQSGTTYVVDNTVYVTVRDLSKLPAILDGAIQAGANNINSIQFDVADKTESLKQARKLAMENAAALAKEMADNAGVSLGEVYNISYSEYYPTAYYGIGGGGGGAGLEAPSAPINPGQLQLTVNVSVTYLITK